MPCEGERTMDINHVNDLIEIGEMYNWLPDKRLALDREVFDFSVVTDGKDRVFGVWSEYGTDQEEVKIYSCIIDDLGWQEPVALYMGKHAYPHVKITSGRGDKIHLLLGRGRGPSDELLLYTYNGTSWEHGRKISDTETHTFGHNIIASQKREKIYIVFGNYQERHYFPYILTALLSGHVGKDFGKLFLIKGDNISWSVPRRITKRGRFSCLFPAICLNDEMDILHIVWEDERLGYWKKAIYYDSFDGSNFVGNIKISENRHKAFFPSIGCDSENNVYVAWSALENENSQGLYYRERVKNSWSKIVKLSDKGGINSVTTDNLGKAHILWEDGSQTHYKLRIGPSWSKTVVMNGIKARICADWRNNVHLLLLSREGKFVYKKLESREPPRADVDTRQRRVLGSNLRS